MKPAPAFPVALASALRAANMSQSELAKRVGCGRSAISNYMSGNRIPPRGMLERINAALGANLSPTRPIKVLDVVRDLRIGAKTIRRGIIGGQLSMIGTAIPSPSGKRHKIVIFPEKYKEFINAHA